MPDYDVLTIGAGPNGLMTSALLQIDGKKVCCVELNDHVGGLASNTHLFPGFVHNTGMWFLMFCQIENLLAKLKLEKYGFELMDPPHVAAVLPYAPPDPVLKLYNDPRETLDSIRKDFGKEASDGFAAMLKWFEPFGVGLELALANPPVSMSTLIDSVPSHEGQQAMKTIFYGTAYDIMDKFFPDKAKCAAIRGYLSFFSTDGFFGGPMTPGSALTLAYHFGTPTPGEGATGSQYKVPRGHTGKFAECIADSFVDHGGILKKKSEVKEILIRNNTAYGVKLADGTEITAKVVISSCDAYNTFVRMVGEKNTPKWLYDAIKEINYTEILTQTYVTTKGLPEFGKGYEDLNDENWRYFILAMGNGEVYEENWNQIKFGKLPPFAGGGTLIPSLLDPTLAPAGYHTMTFCDLCEWPIGTPREKYDETKKYLFEKKCDIHQRFMPNFRDVIQDWKMMGPLDYEERYHNTGGTWTHEDVKIDQMFDMRPVKGMSDNRAPIKHLYLCGSSNHPGPGVNGRTPQLCINAMQADGVI